MSQSARSLSVAVDQAASLATSPQRRHLTFKPCRHLLGCHNLGSRLKQLNRQAIGALALALEIYYDRLPLFRAARSPLSMPRFLPLVRHCFLPGRVDAVFQRDQRSQALCHHPKVSAAA
jgi:hypothetical protein